MKLKKDEAIKGKDFTIINDTFGFRAGTKVKADGTIGMTGMILVSSVGQAGGLFVNLDNLKAA